MNEPSPTGLKPTIRQLMIVILWAALLIAATRTAVVYHLLGNTPDMVCLMVPVIVNAYPMPLLALLFWLLDRPGLLRRWYMAGCLIVASFAGGILFSLMDPVCYALTGKPTMIAPMGPICALVAFWCSWKQWQVARPGSCPRCGCPSVIPIAVRLHPRSRRFVNTGNHGWCASCGQYCERRLSEAWKLVERS